MKIGIATCLDWHMLLAKVVKTQMLEINM